MTDPIADMLTRIRNAQIVNNREVIMPYSNIKFEIAKLLKTNKFVSGVKKVKGESFDSILITLKKDGIKSIDRVSKPGQRIYVKSQDLDVNYKYGKGFVFVSTSQGILDSKTAKKSKLGGEILFRVW